MDREIINTDSAVATQEVILPQSEATESIEKTNEFSDRIHLSNERMSNFNKQMNEAKKYAMQQNDKLYDLLKQLVILKIYLHEQGQYITYIDKNIGNSSLNSFYEESLLSLKQEHEEKNSKMILVKQKIEKLKQEQEQYLSEKLSKILFFDDQQVDIADLSINEANTETETPCDDNLIYNAICGITPETPAEDRANDELSITGNVHHTEE